MHKKWMAVCALVFLVFGTSAAYAADVAKIGLVDLQRILDTSLAGKDAAVKIQQSGQEMEATLKKKGQEINELKQELDRQALVMSREAYTEKARELRIKTNDLKQLQQEYMEEFKRQEARLINEIRTEVFKLVEEIGKRGGYTLILERAEAGVMYIPEGADITDRVITEYNKVFKKRK
ncbi:MAG: OmpH family outer membrane protein [Deltaproteobacteria bacterium]|nr:OmpH family outer membrane protein [Deltaproteobacteria bacterium]